MKRVNFKILIFCIVIFSKTFGQNNPLELKILNDTIFSNKYMVLQVQILNNTNHYILLPLVENSLLGYDYYGDSNTLLSSHNSIEQIILGVRVIDENEKYIVCNSHIPRGESDDFDDFSLGIEDEITKGKIKTIYRTYKRLGIKNDDKWMNNFYFFTSNLKFIDAKSYISLQFVFNFSDFKTLFSNNLEIGKTIIGNSIEINNENCNIYLVLELEEPFLKPYVQKYYELFGRKAEIWDKKIISNKVPIKIQF